jgi:rhomboid protease GluP
MAKAILDLIRTETGQLPMVCMRCGQRATTIETKVFSTNSFPSFRQATRSNYALPFGAGFLEATVQAPFCDEHKNHWAWRSRAMKLSLAGSLITVVVLAVAMILLGSAGHPNLAGLPCVGMAVIGFGWLIFVVTMETTAIRPKRIGEKTVTLTGVSEDFITAYRESVRALGEAGTIAQYPALPQTHDPVLAFHEGLAKITPRPLVTPAIVGLNVAVFVLMLVCGVNVFDPKVYQLIAWGADFGPLTTSGQWWRLFTSMFIHIGIGHLFFNMWALLSVGLLVERLLGKAGFLAVYIFSGLLGSLASIWWNPTVVSAGASGAIFGVYGALVGLLVSRRLSIPSQALSKLRYSTLFFVGINLFYGLGNPHINMAAHLGGLATGFLGGFALSSSLTPEAMAKRPIRNSLVAGAGVLLVGAGILVVPKSMAEYWNLMSDFEPMESKTLDLHKSLFDRLKEHKTTEAEMANVIEAEILPEWRSAHQRAVTLQTRKNLPAKSKEHVAHLQSYMKTREESWELLVQMLREHDSQESESLGQKFLQEWKAANEQAKKISSEPLK